MNKPRIAIIGLGRYYRKIENAIGQYFLPVLLSDAAAAASADNSLVSLVSRYASDAVMLLTPNHLHAQHVCELADLGVPVLVEKPPVTTEADLNSLLNSVDKNPRLYCSDFYLDVRATPLKAWLKQPSPECLTKRLILAPDEHRLWDEGLPGLGLVTGVEAVLLEGEGDSAGFEGREWLWDPVHGGVLWDLAYHYVALWHGLFNDALSLISCETLCTGNGLQSPMTETYASIKFRSSAGTQFLVRVGKYQAHENQRWFCIHGANGNASMKFQKNNKLEIDVRSHHFEASLAGDYYSHVVAAFREYVDSGIREPHGLQPAIAATKLILEAKRRHFNEIREAR